MGLFENAIICLTFALAITYILEKGPFHQSGFQATDNLLDTYDYIVVGGGSAGCIVASRLSEHPEVNVLLLEAGGDYSTNPKIQVPALWGTLLHEEVTWQYYSSPQTSNSLGLQDNKAFLPRGRVLGGSGSINLLQYTRGNSREFDEWDANGCKGWSWRDVLPYFLKSEDILMDDLKTSKFHNSGGPIAVSSTKTTPLADIYLAAGQELGYKVIDYNSDEQEGISPAQINARKGIRSSACQELIAPHTNRKNLHVGLNSFVTKIDISNNRATGVYLIRNNRKTFIKVNKEVILSGGVFNSPQLLMLSGVGPKEHLEELGIPVLKDLPVGLNFQDHPMVITLAKINESYSLTKSKLNSFSQQLQYKLFGSGMNAIAGTEVTGYFYVDEPRDKKQYPDFQMNLVSSYLGANLFNLNEESVRNIVPNTPDTEGISAGIYLSHVDSRGSVKLQSSDPFDYPIIDTQMLSKRSDVEKLIKAIRIWEKFIETNALKRVGVDITPLKVSFCSQHVFRSDAFWECYIRHLAISAYHPSCTCKMGAVDDPSSVVDPQLRVKGIQGLRVVDASVMPNVTAGNTNAPTIMIAEKAADMIRGIDTVKAIREKLWH